MSGEEQEPWQQARSRSWSGIEVLGSFRGQMAWSLFFHRSAILGEGFDALTEGQAVEFDVEKGDKGPRAAHMKVSAPSI